MVYWSIKSQEPFAPGFSVVRQPFFSPTLCLPQCIHLTITHAVLWGKNVTLVSFLTLGCIISKKMKMVTFSLTHCPKSLTLDCPTVAVQSGRKTKNKWRTEVLEKTRGADSRPLVVAMTFVWRHLNHHLYEEFPRLCYPQLLLFPHCHSLPRNTLVKSDFW